MARVFLSLSLSKGEDRREVLYRRNQSDRSQPVLVGIAGHRLCRTEGAEKCAARYMGLSSMDRWRRGARSGVKVERAYRVRGESYPGLAEGLRIKGYA